MYKAMPRSILCSIKSDEEAICFPGGLLLTIVLVSDIHLCSVEFGPVK